MNQAGVANGMKFSAASMLPKFAAFMPKDRYSEAKIFCKGGVPGEYAINDFLNLP